MSETLDTAVNNIRILTGDTNPGDVAADTALEMYRIIISKAQEMCSRINIGETWSTSAFTLTAGSTADYSLLSSVQYHTVYQIRDTVNGRLLQKRSMAEIMQLRYGIIAGTAARGDPYNFALYETDTQVMTIRIDTIPSRAIPMDVLISTLPASTYTGSTVLPFSDVFLRAIEKASAAQLLTSFVPKELERLMINPDVIQRYDADSEKGVMEERLRQYRMKLRPYGVGAVAG